MRVMLAVPTLPGTIDVTAVSTMMAIQRFVLGKGDELETRIHSATGISMLRNLIVADFMTSGCDTLFMLDSDQGVDAAGIGRMFARLESGSDMVGCFYPRRVYNWPAVGKGESSNRLSRLLYQAMEFVGEPLIGADGMIRLEDGFAQADHVGTGALLLRRSVIQRLCAAYPDLAGQGFNRVRFAGFPAEANWGLFNEMVNERDGGMLSEDLSFCRRWRDIGGEIWADATTMVAHAGRHIWSGNYADYLAALRPQA